MRKNFGLTKYPGEKILDHGNTLEKKNFEPTKAQWHDGTRPTKFSIIYAICLCIISLKNRKSKKISTFWIIIH